MTDEELKALVASLAVSQQQTDEQMKRTDEKLERIGIHWENLMRSQRDTDEQMKRSDEKLERIGIHWENLMRSQRDTDEQMKRTDEKLERIGIHWENLMRSQRDTDEQMKRTDEKLERIGIHLGNITHNQGDVAEEFFFNSLASEPRLGRICFDDITKNMQKHRGNIQEEFDLFLTNGEAIAIVEVKYKAHTNDLKKLDRKMSHFKLLFPIYKDYKLYGALASFYINDDTKKEALERGYFVLQRSGNLIHTECPTSQLKIG